MAVEIINAYIEESAACRFIGKRYTPADSVGGSYGHKWGEWWANNWFEPLASCFVKGVFTLFHKRRTVNTIDVKDTYFGNSPFNSHTEATKLIGTPLSDRLRVCLSLVNLFRYLLRYSL